MGEPGSRSRNPFIAAIFHETNLEETKGSGIRTMRKLMEQAKMVPPTFDSNHSDNQFTVRLLLHHFLSEEDIAWLQTFSNFPLNDAQKRALIFIREVGAIDNSTYRQLNGCDTVKASIELRSMREWGILSQKGKGRATYYVPDSPFYNPEPGLSSLLGNLEVKPDDLLTKPDYPPVKPDHPLSKSDQLEPLPEDLKGIIADLGKKVLDREKMNQAILRLCNWRPLSLKDLSVYLNRNEKYLLGFVTALRQSGQITYTIPEMPNHPDQAYQSVNFNNKSSERHEDKI